MRRYLDFCLLAYCTCACLLLSAFAAPESGQDVHSLQRSEQSSLAEAYISIGSACDDLRPNMYRDIHCSLQISILGPPLLTLLQARESSYRENADVRKGGQKILNNLQGT
jgi:hypothetical protein